MNNKQRADDELRAEIYDFLNDLRESGSINMFAAAPFIAREFSMTLDESRKWLSEWMADFE